MVFAMDRWITENTEPTTPPCPNGTEALFISLLFTLFPAALHRSSEGARYASLMPLGSLASARNPAPRELPSP